MAVYQFNPANLFEIPPPDFATNSNVKIPRNNSEIEEIVQLNINKAKELVKDSKYKDDPIERVNKMQEYLVHIRVMEQFLKDNKNITRDKYQTQLNSLLSSGSDVKKNYQQVFTQLQSDPAIEKEAYLVAPRFAIANAWNESLDSAAGYTIGLERLIKSWMPLRYKFYQFYSTPENQAQYNDLVDAMKEHELTQKIEKDKEDRAIMGIMQVLVQSSSDENMKAQAVDMLNKALEAGTPSLQIKKEEAKPAANKQAGGADECKTTKDCGIFSKEGDRLIPLIKRDSDDAKTRLEQEKAAQGQSPANNNKQPWYSFMRPRNNNQPGTQPSSSSPDKLNPFVRLVTDELVKSVTDTLNASQPTGQAPLLPDQVRDMLEDIVRELPKMEEDEREGFLEQVNRMLEDVVGRIRMEEDRESYANPLFSEEEDTDDEEDRKLTLSQQAVPGSQYSLPYGQAPTGLPARAPALQAGLPALAPALQAGLPALAPAPTGQQSSTGIGQRSSPAPQEPQQPVPPNLPQFIGLTAEQSPSPSPCTALPDELRFGNVYANNNIIYYNSSKWYKYIGDSGDDILFNNREEYTQNVTTLNQLANLLQNPTTTLQDVINELYIQTDNEIKLKSNYQNFIIRTNLSIAFCIQGQRYAIGGDNILEVPLQAPAPGDQGLLSIWDKFRQGQEFSRQLTQFIIAIQNKYTRSFNLGDLVIEILKYSLLDPEIIITLFLIENIKEYGDGEGSLTVLSSVNNFINSLRNYSVFDTLNTKYYSLAQKELEIALVKRKKKLDSDSNIKTRVINSLNNKLLLGTIPSTDLLVVLELYNKPILANQEKILDQYLTSSNTKMNRDKLPSDSNYYSILYYVTPPFIKYEERVIEPTISITLNKDKVNNNIVIFYRNNTSITVRGLVSTFFTRVSSLPRIVNPGQVNVGVGGAPTDPQPAQPPAPQAPNIPDDIVTLKANLKKLNNISQMYSELTTQWQGYIKASEPRKEFKDISIGVLIGDLIQIFEKKNTNTNPKNVNEAKENNIYNVFNNKGYNLDTSDDNKKREAANYFDPLRKEVTQKLKQLDELLTPLVTSQDVPVDEQGGFTLGKLKQLKDAAITYEKYAQNTTTFDNITTFLETGKSTLNDAKLAYNKQAGYSVEEVIGRNKYYQDNAEKITKSINDKSDAIVKEVETLLTDITSMSKRYSPLSAIIKKKVYQILEPEKGETSTIQLITDFKELISKMKADIETQKSLFQAKAAGITNKQQKGGADDTELTDIKTKTEKVTKGLDDIRGLLKTFLVSLERNSDPTLSIAGPKGDSIFNLLFNNYLENKEDVKKGNFIAATELADGLKVNDVLPRDVLDITYQDKIIFIFATLFFRLIALTIVDYLIEKGKLMRLHVVFGVYIGIYIGIFYLFLLLVNFDTYKLRIMFNYVNMHSNSSVVFMHPAMVGLFGLVIYYVMWNINGRSSITAANDEDRVRLRYKIQVLSLVVWLLIAILIFLM